MPMSIPSKIFQKMFDWVLTIFSFCALRAKAGVLCSRGEMPKAANLNTILSLSPRFPVNFSFFLVFFGILFQIPHFRNPSLCTDLTC